MGFDLLRFPVGRRGLLKHPLHMFARIALPLGLFFVLLGLVLFWAIGIVGGNIEDARIVLFVISIQGVVWGIIGFVCLCIVSSAKRQLRFLKQNGRQFDAEIISLTPVIGVNVGFTTITVRAECIYLNEQQQRCKVKSGMFIWGDLNPEKLQATVHVDWNDPYIYSLEITERELYQHQVDIDYT